MNTNISSKEHIIGINEHFENKLYQTHELGVSYELRVSFKSDLFQFFLQKFVRKNNNKETLTNTIYVVKRIM